MFVLIHSKVNKLNLIIQIKDSKTDTIVGVYGDIPWDFCINNEINGVFFLYGKNIVKYDINSIENIKTTNIKIGNCTSINYLNKTLFVVNYVNDGMVAKPVLSAYHPSTLDLQYSKKFNSLNYSAFESAISPYQNKQIEVTENKIIFADFTSGMIDIYDLDKDSIYTISQFYKKDKELKKIYKLTKAYSKKSTYKIFDQLNSIYENRRGRIIQCVSSDEKVYIFQLVGNLSQADSMIIFCADKSSIQNFSFLYNFRNEYKLNESMQSNNYSLNEIYTDKLIGLKQKLITIQEVNKCPNLGDNLGNIYLYKPDKTRIYSINQYQLKTY